MTAALEDVKPIDLEEWLTLATAPSPTKLKAGMTPNAQNVWVDEKPGSVITAPGYFKVGVLPSNLPCTFCINYFKTSSGSQTFVASDNATVWTTIDFQNWTQIITGLSSAFQLRGLVIRDKLWLTNGSDAVRTFDGTTVVVLDGTAGTPNVPKGRYISYHDERVWMGHIPSNRSQAAFSALTDSAGTIIAPDNANAWPSSNTLQISEGDADFVTGMLLYRGYLHFFKQYSIWRLVGYDEYTYTRVKTRASTGCRFNESLGILDSLVHLIGIDGIYVFDGEETARISDIIDPATATQSAFGFNQIQQPNVNNQFWQVASTADWNAGTVPSDLAVANAITLKAADDSQADFQAGPTQTNVDLTTTPGILQLAVTSSGVSNNNVATGQAASFTGAPTVGNAAMATDGDLSTNFGFTAPFGSFGQRKVNITISSPLNLTRIILKSFRNQGGQATIAFTRNGGTVLPVSSVSPASGGGMTFSVSGGQITVTGGAGGGTTPIDLTINFSSFTATSIECIFFNDGTGTNPTSVMTEIQVFSAAYNTTGKFTSKTLDLGITPAAYGNFSALVTLNGEGATYFTQSSADGIAWDAEVAVANGGAIASVVRRYLRWGTNLTSDGLNTPAIDAAYLPAVYLSAIHDTGGSIFAWGPLEADRTLPSQCNFYYRTATTSLGIAAASWNLIVPGGVLSAPVANRFVQFKIEILNGDSTHLPVVSSVTINWIVGTGVQFQVLQNVASYVWRNRYWMACAGPGATANNQVLVRGKKTFNSPWQLKDFPFLSFTRYQDSLYAGSSQDGSVFQVDTGHSKNGSPIDSFFQTGDFTFGGFYINPLEILIEVERSGPYNLTVGLSIDRGNSWTDYNVDLTPSTFAPSYTKRINVATLTTDRIRFRVRTNGIDQPFEVHRLIFYYRPEVARGSIK